jgi:hypothetical protein
MRLCPAHGALTGSILQTMSFGPAKGLDFATFSKVVKKMRIVILTGTARYEAEMPLEMFNVPICNIEIQIPQQIRKLGAESGVP